jgi:hypothetical protein
LTAKAKVYILNIKLHLYNLTLFILPPQCYKSFVTFQSNAAPLQKDYDWFIKILYSGQKLCKITNIEKNYRLLQACRINIVYEENVTLIA